jgi:hypothetical protein
MGSILSQVGQKCYRQTKKSSSEGAVRGILKRISYSRAGAQIFSERLFLTEEPRYPLCPV